MDEPDEKDWVLRFRLTSRTMSLGQLEDALGVTGGMGSFSVGEKIHDWLQSLEKSDAYDESRLQLSFEFKNPKSIERKALWLLDKLDPGLKRVQRFKKTETKLEWSIEYYGKSPLYYSVSSTLIDRSSAYGMGLHLVIWTND